MMYNFLQDTKSVVYLIEGKISYIQSLKRKINDTHESNNFHTEMIKRRGQVEEKAIIARNWWNNRIAPRRYGIGSWDGTR
jgi:hypothetical protein